MNNRISYPFYKSLRFRIGLIFGVLFLFFLLGIVLFLYFNVKKQLEQSFEERMEIQAKTVLQKTELNPLTIPLPQSGEYFILIYNNGRKLDTIFSRLPPNIHSGILFSNNYRSITVSRTMETGGIIIISYVLPAKELNTGLSQLKSILFIYVPLAFIIAFVGGYFLSGYLLRPITHIIDRANDTSLQNEIQMLTEPEVKDELHRLSLAFNRMLERIKKQSQDQNAFFASASHELRTPLSVMLTELQTIQSVNLSTEVNTVIKNQIEEVRRLNKIVNDFLFMSHLKSTSYLYLKTEKNSLVEVTMECFEQIQKKATVKVQILKIDLEPTEGEFLVTFNKDHLSIIIFNLIENAVKYGLTKSVISVRIEQGLKNVSIRIMNETDKTIDQLSQLKQRFRQENTMNEGFGLGLWIVDELAKLNNASLFLKSDPPYFIAEIVFIK